jgi:hypothetical protein
VQGVSPIIAGRLLSHEGPDCGNGGAVRANKGEPVLGLMGCEVEEQRRGLWVVFAPHHYFGGLDS